MTKFRRLPDPPEAGELFDELLVIMAQQGDRLAAQRLYLRWNGRLLRAARRYCGDGDAANDLVQECWLGIWKGLRKLRNPAPIRSYAFAILHRRGADHTRARMRDRAALSEAMPDESAPSTPHADQNAAIKQAFASLPPDQRLAAHLHFVEGLTLAEIAEAQSIPTGTAKSRLFHARRKLKAALT